MTTKQRNQLKMNAGSPAQLSSAHSSPAAARKSTPTSSPQPSKHVAPVAAAATMVTTAIAPVAATSSTTLTASPPSTASAVTSTTSTSVASSQSAASLAFEHRLQQRVDVMRATMSRLGASVSDEAVVAAGGVSTKVS
jgi:hypothetical protein